MRGARVFLHPFFTSFAATRSRQTPEKLGAEGLSTCAKAYLGPSLCVALSSYSNREDLFDRVDLTHRQVVADPRPMEIIREHQTVTPSRVTTLESLCRGTLWHSRTRIFRFEQRFERSHFPAWSRCSLDPEERRHETIRTRCLLAAN